MMSVFAVKAVISWAVSDQTAQGLLLSVIKFADIEQMP